MDLLQQRALMEITDSFTRGDQELVGKIKVALEHPPTKTEEIGYYVSGKETPFENCFRKMASLLAESPYSSSAEDKYVYEIFDQWLSAEHLDDFPPEFRMLFAELLDANEGDEDEVAEMAGMRERLKDGYAMGVRALELAFEAKGAPLVSIDTGEGDTLLFICVPTAVAEKWKNIQIGVTHEDIPLAIRAPMWDRFWHHLDYALGLELGDPPADLGRPEPLRPLSDMLH